ncbi:MAG: glycosyltransferase family 2 protein [Chloroflexi bacterium]|nr:glycosyltransferase family 2 protein [Chloroflexota bacterium]
MDLAIVIVSYNTRELTLGCLASVYQELSSAGLEGQVWVIDNASEDGSAQAIAAQFPQATLLASDANLGFARGVNRGMECIEQTGNPPDYILLLNPDTLIQPGAIWHLLGFMRTKPSAAAAGAQLLYADGSFQHGAFHFPTLLMAFFDFWTINHRLINSSLNGRYPLKRYRDGQPFKIDHPLGAAMLVRLQAWKQIGPLDAGYFMYCEEIDWCMRAHRTGWEVYCVPQAQIVHYAGQSTKQFKAAMFIALWRSRYRLFGLYYSKIYQYLVKFIVRAGLNKQISRTRREVAAHMLHQDEAERIIDAYRRVKEF